MAKSLYGHRWIFPLAIAASVIVQAASFAQTKDWNDDELARPFPEAATEQQLIEQLRSGAPEEKVIACKQLAIYGSKAAVPELAKLLSDEHLASWSRIALEAIPDPSTDAALVAAAGKLQGKLLVGVINSIGVKRSTEAADQLVARLKDADEDVASAAAVALGRIGGEREIHALHEAFPAAKPAVQSAIAEGGILWAERWLADGKNEEAAEVYDLIRNADLPKQRIVEATRGAILARGDQGMGIALLVEQLKSADMEMFQIALSTARELPGNKVAEALSAQLAGAAPERASLIIYAIGDREGVVMPPSVLAAATTGDVRVRLAAIELVGRLGDASAVPALLEIAGESDAELSQAAKRALARLPGKDVDVELVKRLSEAESDLLPILFDAIGQRRIGATAHLVKGIEHSDEAVRHAALTALGATATSQDLAILIAKVKDPKNDADAEVAWGALESASIRMPDRESAAAVLASQMPLPGAATEARLLRILGAMGGPTALRTVAAAAKSDDPELQDAGTRVLGEWMTADAAGPLYEIASSDHKYDTRALRGYLRIARQSNMTDAERLEMCRKALAVAERDEERELALEVTKRCPSAEAVELASSLLDDAELRQRAVEAAVFIGEKIKDTDPAAARSAGRKALEAAEPGELADRARALTSP